MRPSSTAHQAGESGYSLRSCVGPRRLLHEEGARVFIVDDQLAPARLASMPGLDVGQPRDRLHRRLPRRARQGLGDNRRPWCRRCPAPGRQERPEGRAATAPPIARSSSRRPPSRTSGSALGRLHPRLRQCGVDQPRGVGAEVQAAGTIAALLLDHADEGEIVDRVDPEPRAGGAAPVVRAVAVRQAGGLRDRRRPRSRDRSAPLRRPAAAACRRPPPCRSPMWFSAISSTVSGLRMRLPPISPLLSSIWQKRA